MTLPHNQRLREGFVEHGIFTSAADYWLHLHPLDGCAYWYRRSHAVNEFWAVEYPLIDAKSKNGSITGAGYLVDKQTYFVQSCELPARYLSFIADWAALTDRQRGFFGQRAVLALIDHGIIRIPSVRSESLNERSDQYAGQDCRIVWLQPASLEIKTDCIDSTNLFVQVGERSHQVHLARVDGNVVENITTAPELF